MKLTRRKTLELLVKVIVSISALTFLTSSYFLKRGAPDRIFSEDEKPVFIADLSKIKDPSTVKFEIGGTHGILIKYLDTLVAFDAACTHMGCPVSGRLIGEGIIQCPCHGSTFDPRTGERLSGPASGPLRRIEIEIRGGKIYALPT